MMLVAFALAQTSCKSQKTIALQQDNKEVVEKKSNQNIFNHIIDNDTPYQNIQAKGKIQIGSKNSAAVLKIVKDSVIQISIRPMIGVEMIRVDITPTRTVLIDRVNNKYSETDIKELTSNKIEFNFFNLQALLTDRLFLSGQKNLNQSDYKKFKYETRLFDYILKNTDKNNVSYTFFANNTGQIIEINFTQPENKANMIWRYGNFKKDNNENYYASEILAHIEYNKKKKNVGLSYKSWDVDKKINVDLNIPKKYEKIDLQVLISQFF